jgi:hypothetical protein
MKSVVSALVIGLLVSAGPACGAEPAAADPQVAAMAAEISEREFLGTVEALQAFGSRVLGQPGNGGAAAYLHERFRAIPGLSVAYQDAGLSNVVATLKGTGADLPVLIVGAHYDSMSSDPPHAPGATDNAAGVGVVLELARVLSRHTFRHTIQFACWNGEEDGCRGSKSFAEEARKRGTPIALYINYDSTAYDPQGRKVLDLMYDSVTAFIRDLMATNNSLYRIGFRLVENRHDCDGDHMSFRSQGYAAIMTHQETHGAHYHTPRDRIDRVSAPYACSNARLGVTVLAVLDRMRERK